jgi:hypothetical protein
VVADRLIDETVALEVEQQRVLAVVQREIDEHRRIAERNPSRDEVTVEACVRLPDRGSRGQPEPQAVAVAVRVGPERQIPRLRVD